MTPDRAKQLFEAMPPLKPPPVNPEKVRDVYKNIRPYVPAEFQNCSLYAEPSNDQAEAAQSIKRRRVTHRAGEKARTEAAEGATRSEAAAVMQRATEIQNARAKKKKNRPQVKQRSRVGRPTF